MPESRPPPRPATALVGATSGRVETTTVPLVGLCVLGLLVAGFTLPAASDGGGTTSPETDANVSLPELPGRSNAACTIRLRNEPTPGGSLTLVAARDGDPLVDRRVWFNDRLVGRTDANGRASGQVPYSRELRIRVSTPGGRCVLTGGSPSAGAGAPGRVARNAGAAVLSPEPVAQSGRNSSGTLTVDGRVRLAVRGQPYPGDTIALTASIEGVPMRDATVRVNGRRVGRTDDQGRYRLRVPDDGTRRLRARVSRGDFEGSRTIEVLVLELSLAPSGLVAVPGGRATVRATVGDRPVPNRPVVVDGEVVGRTDARGEVTVRLPADPATEFSVAARDQSARMTLWVAYGTTVLTALALATTAIGSTVVAGRRYGSRARVVVAAGWVGFVGLLGGYLAGGLAGLGVAAVGVGLLWGWLAWRYRGETVVRSGRGAGGWLAVLLARLRGVALRVADGLSETVGAAIGWLRTRPRSLRGLAVALRVRLVSLPARVWARLRVAAGRVRQVRSTGGVVRPAAAVLVLVTIVGGSFALAGAAGVAVAVLVLALAGAVYAGVWRSDPAGDAEGDGTGEGRNAGRPETPTTPSDEARTLRDLWRAFAREVVPQDRDWESRTPGEVARRAVRSGYPRDPVRQLTGVFREVEYGDQPRSEDRVERARRAFDRLQEDEP